MRWSLLANPRGRRGAQNMSIDAALLRAAQGGDAFLRLYTWDPGCLSFGRNEPAATRYDRVRIATMGLDTVRRPTGGRAVWHEREITYAVAGPIGAFGSPRAAYVAIHEVIAAALQRLGVRAEVAGRAGPTPLPDAGACFASPAGGEVVVGQRKLVGSAQVREGQSFLQHGSVLIEDGQDVVSRVTRGTAAQPAATSLADQLGRTPDFAELADAIAAAARAAWTGRWSAGQIPIDADDRFADPAWTWRR